MKSYLILICITFFSTSIVAKALNETPGCTDETACNYDCQATIDDGSCEFSCYGCTSPTALNYDQTATIDDGSCEEPSCFDWNYCYGSNETSDFLFTSNSQYEVINLSFTSGFMEATYDFIYFYDGVDSNASLLAGPIDGDLTNLSVQSTGQNLFVRIVTDELISCEQNTSISAINATYCNVFVTILGCTDVNSTNYNSEANLDDGSCDYIDCDTAADIDWSNQTTDVYPNGITLNLGSEINIAAAINVNDTWFNEVDGNLYDITGFELQSVSGLPEGIDQSQINNMLPFYSENGTQICLPLNGLIYPTGLFEVEYTGVVTILIASTEIELPAVFNQTIEVIWDGSAILGCTYPGADNYNFVATLDNSLCVFSGCTDSSALNFLPSANLDDGSCIYPESVCGEGLIWVEELQACVSPNASCPGDFNGDNAVTASDLTAFLVFYGSVCE